MDGMERRNEKRPLLPPINEYSPTDECKGMPADEEQDEKTSPVKLRTKKKELKVTWSYYSMPVTYSWEIVSAYLEFNPGNAITRLSKKTPPPNPKKILDNIRGVVRPGECLAVMGASGAGKTTLLNCLTFRSPKNLQVIGQRFLNGKKADPDTLASVSGYVQQDDLFVPTLTVKEQLRFQALLRMPKSFTYDERMIRVDEVIDELGLEKCADEKIGNPQRGIKGISGGERKRLAFGCEILTNPSLIFCDEPISGLDSFMAVNVIQVLKNMAERGRTVLCTIHQPSSEVFALFDRILLMAAGRVAFLGPVKEAANFFASISMPCPVNFNPADFYIHSLAIAVGRGKECRERCKMICDAYDQSQHAKRVEERVAANRGTERTELQDLISRSKTNTASPYRAHWFTQFRAVLWRSMITVIREPNIIRVKAFQTIFLGCLVALVFQGQDYDYRSIRNIQGAIFVSLTNLTFQCILGVINDITGEFPIFLREHFNGMYRTDVYFICKTLSDLPLYLFFPFVQVAIPYYIVGLNPAVTRFFTACGIVILTANVATAFGYVISCISSSTQVALALGPPLMIPLSLFGGYFINNAAMPAYCAWLRYFSWFFYANEALSINQWTGVKFNDTQSSCPNHMCSDEYILNLYDFDANNFNQSIVWLFVMIVVLRLLAFLALLKKTYGR